MGTGVGRRPGRGDSAPIATGYRSLRLRMDQRVLVPWSFWPWRWSPRGGDPRVNARRAAFDEDVPATA
ncbi:hypothetical protein HBB16_03715 [Pseudonocardia sp. MCCB 268]|nr:hypothetical protein [Pseudonocardia cytotoxica]